MACVCGLQTHTSFVFLEVWRVLWTYVASTSSRTSITNAQATSCATPYRGAPHRLHGSRSTASMLAAQCDVIVVSVTMAYDHLVELAPSDANKQRAVASGQNSHANKQRAVASGQNSHANKQRACSGQWPELARE
jgi:hypothetical protein